MIERPLPFHCDVCGGAHTTAEHDEYGKQGLSSNKNDADERKENVISFERFLAARKQREQEKNIEAVQESFVEDTEKLEELEGVLDRLSDTYDGSFDSLGDTIDDRIVEHQTDREQRKGANQEASQKGLHVVDAEELAMENDLQQWEAVFPEWQDLCARVAEEERQLFELMGQSGFREYYLSLYHNEEAADELIRVFTEEAGRAQQEKREREHKEWLDDELERERREREEDEGEETGGSGSA